MAAMSLPPEHTLKHNDAKIFCNEAPEHLERKLVHP